MMRLMNDDPDNIIIGSLMITLGSLICLGAGTCVHDTHNNTHTLYSLGIYTIGERIVKRGDDTLTSAGVDSGIQSTVERVAFTLSAFLVGALVLKDATYVCLRPSSP